MPDNAIYLSTLSSVEKESFGALIREISRITHSDIQRREVHYEFISKQRAIASRAILPNLSLQERILLRLYGRFGLHVNRRLREFKLEPKSLNRELQTRIAEYHFNRFKSKMKINSEADIGRLNNSLVWIELTDNAVIRSIRNKISDLIEQKHGKFPKIGYVYRVSRAKKTAYDTDSPIIKPGDLIMDDAFWSTTSDYWSALYRYSSTEGKATNSADLAADEEEILYIIDRNQAMKGIDISGYKVVAKDEKFSSGEILLDSRSRFRVIGIQKNDRLMQRRIVVLRPEETPDPIATGAGVAPIPPPRRRRPAFPSTSGVSSITSFSSSTSVTAPSASVTVEGAVGGAVAGDIVRNPFNGDIIPDIS